MRKNSVALLGCVGGLCLDLLPLYEDRWEGGMNIKGMRAAILLAVEV